MIIDTDQSSEDLLVALGNRDIVRRSWVRAGAGTMPGGVVGGDGAEESLAVDYINRYLPNARITEYFFVVDMRARDPRGMLDGEPPFVVAEMIHYFLGDRPVSDPEVEEVWSDYEHHDHARLFRRADQAERERDVLAQADHGFHFGWSGETSRRALH